MKYFTKLSPEIEAIQNTSDSKKVLRWLQKWDTSGAYYKVINNHRRNPDGKPIFSIYITESVESIVPENAYIILREEQNRFSRFRWHAESTFNTLYSPIKLN